MPPIPLSASSDDELVELVRRGDDRAYGELWVRHAAAAHAVARSFTSLDPDDVAAEAFARILASIRNGGGPSMGFRPYLLTTVRNVAREWGARQQRVDTTDLESHAADDAPDAADEAIAALEASATTSAFRSLPTRWQEALWYSEVDGLKPRQFAPLLGLAPNAASALVLRTRRGFRDAWITAQLRRAESEECRRTLELLGSHTRDALSRRDARRVDAHVAGCASCALAWDEARDVSSRLVLVLLPIVVGVPAAAAYAAWVQGGGAQSAAVALGTGSAVGPAPVRGLRRIPRNTAIGAGVGVAAAAAIAIGALAFSGVWTTDAAAPPVAAQADGASDAGAPGTGTDVAESRDSAPEPAETPLPEPGPAPEPLPPTRVTAPTVPPRATPVLDPTPAPAPSAVPTPTPTPTPSAPPLTAPTMTVDASAGPAVYPLLSGVAQPHATVEIVDETGVVRASTAADGDGVWTVEDLSGGACTTDADAYLSPGSHTIAARQRLDELASPAGTAATITVAAAPQLVSPAAGASVARSGFTLAVHGEPGLAVQRIKLPDSAPCRPTPMVLGAAGTFSGRFTVPDVGKVTIGVRYLDTGTGRHGPATFTTFTAH